MVAVSAMAVDMPDGAKKGTCTACHAIDNNVVGPAWMDVSKKYQGDAGAAAHLDGVISPGGMGVWGSSPMPAMTKVSDAYRKAMIDFILGLAKLVLD